MTPSMQLRIRGERKVWMEHNSFYPLFLILEHAMVTKQIRCSHYTFLLIFRGGNSMNTILKSPCSMIIEWFEGDNNDDEDDFESGRIKPIILPFPGDDQEGGSKEGSETGSDHENVVKPFPPPGGEKSGSESESENENVVKPFPPLSDGKTESNETTTDNVIKPFPAPGNGK